MISQSRKVLQSAGPRGAAHGGSQMAELVAIGFDNPQEADRVLTELARLQREYLIGLEDAVVAIRQPDGKVNLKQSINMIGMGRRPAVFRARSGARSSACC